MTTEIIQQQLEDIKQRLSAVEHKAENRAAVGPRGPQGPPGFHSNVPGPQGNAGLTGTAGRNGRDGRTPGKDELEFIILTILQDYKVLDEDNCPYAGPYAKK